MQTNFLINPARWALAQWVINTFWPPLCEEDGVPLETIEEMEWELGVHLPLALMEWYAFAGRRRDLFDVCDWFAFLEADSDEGHVDNDEAAAPTLRDRFPEMFDSEEEVVFWFMGDAEVGSAYGVPLYEPQPEDPPVFVDPDAGRVEFAHESFCIFMHEYLMNRTMLLAPFRGGTTGTLETVQVIRQRYQLLPTTPNLKSIRYGNDAILIGVGQPEDEKVRFGVIAKTRAAVEEFCECVGCDISQFTHRSFFWSHQMHSGCEDASLPHIVIPTEEMEGNCEWPPCHSPERGMTDYTYVKGGYQGFITFRAS